MEKFLKLSVSERNAYFIEAANRMGISPLIVEKDFWVCLTLKLLFDLPDIRDHMIFKGGTSLSKAFNLIERFSEDIDISLDKNWLGPNDEFVIDSNTGTKEGKRRIDALISKCQEKINDDLMPNLESSLLELIDDQEEWKLTLDSRDKDEKTLLLKYPSDQNYTEYTERSVIIEIGARSDHWPAEERTIQPYVAELILQFQDMKGVTVKTLAAKRTFWEKVTILHAECHRPLDKGLPPRLSRHFYDVYCLIEAGIGATELENTDLLNAVVEHKRAYFRSGWARYDLARPGTLRLVPDSDRLNNFRSDYAQMREMIFRDPPDFDEMTLKIKEWEEEFNSRVDS